MVLTPLKEQLIRHEGVRLKPYRDSVGILTVGCGRNLDAVGLTYDEAMFLLDNDIQRVMRALRETLPYWLGLDEGRRQVLINMAFNLGVAGLLKFKKMLAHVEAGQYDAAADEMLNSAWAVQVGQRAQELSAQMRTGEMSNGQ